MSKKFDQIIRDTIQEKYPFHYEFSTAKIDQWKSAHRKGEDVTSLVHLTLQNLSKNTNYPFFWYDNGCGVEDSFYYAKNAKSHKFRLCEWCNTVFAKSEGHKTCCSVEHFDLHMNRRNERLSESRLKYNSRDPVQYAKRHGISVTEATEIVDKIVTEGSQCRVEYWLKRGYSEEDARKEISKIQSSRSRRSPLYWMKKGLTENEAKKKVSEVQASYSKIRHSKYTKEEILQQSAFSVEYWINKGYSSEEATQIVSENSKRGFQAILSKYTSEERRRYNARCVEYWQERFPDCWKERFEDFLRDVFSSSSFRSNIADEFVIKLSEYFPNEKIYCLDKEFGIYCEDRYIRMDFVNLDRQVCVEFLGDYWHANPKKYAAEEIIRYPNKVAKKAKDVWEQDENKFDQISKRGLRVITVWESDYLKNKEDCIRRVLEEIKNENYQSDACRKKTCI